MKEGFDDDFQSASRSYLERAQASIAFHQVAEWGRRLETECRRNVLERASFRLEQIGNDHQSHPVEQCARRRQTVASTLLHQRLHVHAEHLRERARAEVWPRVL